MSEREVRRKKRKKKAQIKPLQRDRDLNPRTLPPEPSVLSIRPRRPALIFGMLSASLIQVLAGRTDPKFEGSNTSNRRPSTF